MTLLDNASACAGDSGGWTAAGVAARAVVCAAAAAGSAMADMAANVTGVAIAAPRKISCIASDPFLTEFSPTSQAILR